MLRIIFKLKKKNPLELLFLSLVISSLGCIGLSFILILLKVSANVILSIISPVWISVSTLVYTAWKES